MFFTQIETAIEVIEIKSDSDDEDSVLFIKEVVNKPNLNDDDDQLSVSNFQWIELIDLTSEDEDDERNDQPTETTVQNNLEVSTVHEISHSTSSKDDQAHENSHQNADKHSDTSSNCREEPQSPKPTSSSKNKVKPKRKKRKRIVISCSGRKRQCRPKETNQNDPSSLKTRQTETSSSPVDQLPSCVRRLSANPSSKKRPKSARPVLDPLLEESFEFIRDLRDNKIKKALSCSSLPLENNNGIREMTKRKKVRLVRRLHNDHEPEDFDLENM